VHLLEDLGAIREHAITAVRRDDSKPLDVGQQAFFTSHACPEKHFRHTQLLENTHDVHLIVKSHKAVRKPIILLVLFSGLSISSRFETFTQSTEAEALHYILKYS